MTQHFRPAFVLLVLFSLMLGLAYPLAMTGVSSVVFPAQASGSQVVEGKRLIGSSLIGQSFVTPGYFHPRPSASGYDAMASGGSNLGPLSKKLMDRVAGDIDPVRGPVPADAVTMSASGLDPDISPQNALMQVSRVAAARNLAEDSLTALVSDHITGRLWGLFGEPRVNVLALNLALDKLSGK